MKLRSEIGRVNKPLKYVTATNTLAYQAKEFITAVRSLYYNALLICNGREMDRLCNKLVIMLLSVLSGLEKHTSLLWNYEFVMFYSECPRSQGW